MIVDKESTFPNGMALSSKASFVVKIESKKDIIEVSSFAKKEGLPLLALGEGTNIAPNNYFRGVVAILNSKGVEKNKEKLKIQAGERWDDIVRFAVEKDLAGIEALSAIPGKAGAAPIQNIGAYGSEICNTLESLEAYDREKDEFVILSKKDCEFSYRDSLFKKNKDRFIIASITINLSKKILKIPEYRDVQNYFNERRNISPSLKEIREAIIEIRKNKLPDPSIIPNCGSFFKNPFVSKNLATKIKGDFSAIPIFEQNGKIKIPAGFLIDSLGFKGKKLGKIEVYKNNALVLTNPNRASFNDLILAKETIQKEVFTKFGIMLEPEVNIIQN